MLAVPPAPTPAAKPPPRSRPASARRNASAYTGFVVLSAVSTAVFLAGTGWTLHAGFKYGRSAGKEALLSSAAQQSDRLFDRGGQLNADAQDYSAGVPGLYGLLQRIETRAEREDGNLQATLQRMKSEARAERVRQERRLRDSAIAAGCGLVGMLIFISAAKITRHRGLMLFGGAGGRRGRRVLAQWAPAISASEFGLRLSLDW